MTFIDHHRKLIRPLIVATLILFVGLIPTGWVFLTRNANDPAAKTIFLNALLWPTLFAFVISNWRFGYVLSKTNYFKLQIETTKRWICFAIYFLIVIHYFIILGWTIYHCLLVKQYHASQSKKHNQSDDH